MKLLIIAVATIAIVASLSVPNAGETHIQPSEKHMQQVQYLSFEPLYIKVSNKKSLTNFKESL